jgi:hypothetical protein
MGNLPNATMKRLSEFFLECEIADLPNTPFYHLGITSPSSTWNLMDFFSMPAVELGIGNPSSSSASLSNTHSFLPNGQKEGKRVSVDRTGRQLRSIAKGVPGRSFMILESWNLEPLDRWS